MIYHAHQDEALLSQLKAQTAFYSELPFNTGDFLIIAHYKLIAHYSRVLKQMEGQVPGHSLPEEDAYRRKELHEEVLFQLGKVLALTSLTEEQLTQLHAFKALHEEALHEITNIH